MIGDVAVTWKNVDGDTNRITGLDEKTARYIAVALKRAKSGDYRDVTIERTPPVERIRV